MGGVAGGGACPRPAPAVGAFHARHGGRLDLTATTGADSVSPERHAAIVAARPTGAERGALLAELAAAHERVRALVTTLDEATFVRSAPVIYPPASAPYATSCRDIMGWLTDHYDEHTAQAATGP